MGAMRYVTPTILLAALASVSLQARAETPARANGQAVRATAPQVVLVSVLGDTAQALLKDRIRGEYVVVRVGERVGDYRVTRISPNQIVLSSASQPTQHYVLPRMPPARVAGVPILPILPLTMRPAPTTPTGTARTVGTKPAKPINPYPALPIRPAPKAATGPTNPYRMTTATAVPAPTVTAVVAPPGHRASAKPPVTIMPAKSAARRATPTTRKPLLENRSVRRAELEAAVADFGTLSKEVQLTHTAGYLVISGLARGSFFHRVGLRKGDILRKVAGRQVHTLDDGATVYAAVMTASAFDVVVERGGKQITLRYRVTK